MPLRTINDAVFAYTDSDGIKRYPRRGEVADIPEGEDLERGDKHGSFTPDGEEPLPPSGTSMPDISVDWDQGQFRSYVDDASIQEILKGLNEVPEEARITAASSLLKAEESRPGKVRKTLVEELRSVIGDEAPEVELPAEDVEILDDEDDTAPEPIAPITLDDVPVAKEKSPRTK
jgi:hypothetical protein